MKKIIFILIISISSSSVFAESYDCEGVNVIHLNATYQQTADGNFKESEPEKLIVGGIPVQGIHTYGELNEFDVDSSSVQVVGRVNGEWVSLNYQPVHKEFMFISNGVSSTCKRN